MRVVLGTRDWTTTGVIGDGEGEGNGFVYNNERVVRKTIAGEDTRTANSAVAAAPRACPAETKAKLDRLRVIIQVKDDDGDNKSEWLDCMKVVVLLVVKLLDGPSSSSSSSPGQVHRQRKAWEQFTTSSLFCADGWLCCMISRQTQPNQKRQTTTCSNIRREPISRPMPRFS